MKKLFEKFWISFKVKLIKTDLTTEYFLKNKDHIFLMKNYLKIFGLFKVKPTINDLILHISSHNKGLGITFFLIKIICLKILFLKILYIFCIIII